MENKSKFGLAAGLTGSLVYLIGGFNSTGLLILFIAIALWEENEFVKVSVKRVAVLFLGYTVLTHALSLLYMIINLFFNGGLFNKIYNKVDTVVDIAYYVIIIFLALKSLVKPVVETSVLDGQAVDAVANAVNNVANSVAASNAKAAANVKVCPKCGKEVDANATFCTGCGAKFEEKAE